jgi:hypothetical protein
MVKMVWAPDTRRFLVRNKIWAMGEVGSEEEALGTMTARGIVGELGWEWNINHMTILACSCHQLRSQGPAAFDYQRLQREAGAVLRLPSTGLGRRRYVRSEHTHDLGLLFSLETMGIIPLKNKKTLMMQLQKQHLGSRARQSTNSDGRTHPRGSLSHESDFYKQEESPGSEDRCSSLTPPQVLLGA